MQCARSQFRRSRASSISRIEPSLTKYRPGEKAKIKLKLTQSISGPDGSQPVPFVGSTVVAVYDKAIEYISAGFYFPGIRDFFWNWRRFHSACTDSSFDRWFANELKAGETGMHSLSNYFGPRVQREHVRRRKRDDVATRNVEPGVRWP